MKKYLAILLTAAILLCAAPLAGFAAIDWPEIHFGRTFHLSAKAAEIVASGNCGEVDEEKGLDGSQVTWTLDSDGVLTISGTGAIKDFIWGESPWDEDKTIKTILIQTGVTKIGKRAFPYCAGLTSVTIPNSVTSIGQYAFRDCTELTSVVIPNSVTDVEKSAFSGCTALEILTIGKVIEKFTLSYMGMSKKNLKTVVITDGVTRIGEDAFWDCTGLTSVKIPDSVTSIGDGAFERCTGLTSVKIPDGVTSIGEDAFWGCTGLTSVTLPDSVTSIGDSAFSGCTGLTSLTIPVNVTDIERYTFSGCTALETLTIGKAIEQLSFSSIMTTVFNENLKTVVITDGVTRIGNHAFDGCTGLTSVTIPDSVTSIGERAFYDCRGLSSVTIPESVTSIGDSAFSDCTGLTSVRIPDSVTSIGERAFYDCTGLTNLSIGNSVTSIKLGAFQGCPVLETLTIGKTIEQFPLFSMGSISNEILKTVVITDGVTIIGDSAFYGCTGLTAVTIPDSVTSIGGSAFSGCTGLTSLTIPDSVMNIERRAFSGCTNLTEVTIPDSVTSIGEKAFCDCTELESVSIGNSITSIERGVFQGCTALKTVKIGKTIEQFSLFSMGISTKNLKNVTITDGVTSIGDSAFSHCTGLTSVTIPASVTSIGDWAFYNCTGLTSVTIPDSVKDIGNRAFYGCTGLAIVTIPEGVTDIGAFAFTDCTSLTSVTIPDSVTYIGVGAFSGLTSLFVADNNPKYVLENNCIINKETKTLVLGCQTSVIPTNGSVTSIEDYAFHGCVGLTSVAIPNSVTNIGNYAFYGCTGLKEVTIPDSVTNIGYEAFRGCERLSSMIIPDSVTRIKEGTFRDCFCLSSIIIPASVTVIEKDFKSGYLTAIPSHTVIYGYIDSYAHHFAEENNRAFVPIGDAAVTMNAQEVVNEPAVNVYGFANPGAAVVCSVNGAEAVTVQAAASGRWDAEIPLTGAKDGDIFEIKATATADGKIAETIMAVTYKPDAILVQAFALSHSYYSVNLAADKMGVSVPNFTFVPGRPLSFKIKATNSDRIGKLSIVSTKNGESKEMDLTYNEATGCWFAEGFFDEADKNYVPGVFTVKGVDRDGKMFDCGATVKINFLIDPSGYAYEAVTSNKLEDVTAAVYYKDEAGHELLWNAETADQLNPVATLADGAFAWVVPEGTWQVRLTKEGYKEARSEWMDVPPEYTDVYLGMAQTAAPEAAYCNVYADRAEITFSQYMDIESVNTDNVKFDGYTGSITPIDKTETEEGSGIFYATAFTFTPDKAFAGDVRVTIGDAANHAGMAMVPFTATFTVAAEPNHLTAGQGVTVKYGETAEIEITAENAAGKTVAVTCDSANITPEAKTLTLDETGKTTLTVTGDMPGTANLTFTLEGTLLTATAKVTVEVPGVPTEPEQPTGPATPTDPDEPGPATPTDPDQPGPATPTDPDEPGPATPTDPDQPGPATPTDPDQPGPATPTDPDQPGPATPTDPDQPGPATPTDPEYVPGDVNGDGKVGSDDARLALRTSVKLEPAITEGTAAYKAADYNGDGVVKSEDARAILRVSVKLDPFA